MTDLRFAFAGDRAIAVDVLDFLLNEGVSPVALLVPALDAASHAGDLAQRCNYLPDQAIARGKDFRSERFLDLLRAERVDLLLSVHFPYLIPPDVLAIPRLGALNLHPSYLPYNRGWHTVTWALLDGTPVGATLHVIDEGMDRGPIVNQRLLEVYPSDTAADIYPRLASLEFDVFTEAWPEIAAGTIVARPQDIGLATTHKRGDLSESVRRIPLDSPITGREFLRHLRALTTSRLDEAAFFEEGGHRYCVQVSVFQYP